MEPFVPVRKFYVRHSENVPDGPFHALAADGFRQLGVELSYYGWHEDVEGFSDLGPEVGVAGYIGDVWAALKRIGRAMPAPLDYPDALRWMLGRELSRTTLGRVRSTVKPVFVKPVDHKLFTGFVHRADGESRMRVVTLPDEVEVWVSDVMEFISEHRCFILKGEILDVRRYKGDWAVAPYRAIVRHAASTWTTAPVAWCLDVGVTKDGHTRLVEANDGFCFGGYGLSSTLYARMLAARWFELASAEPVAGS